MAVNSFERKALALIINNLRTTMEGKRLRSQAREDLMGLIPGLDPLTSNGASLRSSARTLGFGLLLLVSGFCGISYEILYARILSNDIGDQFAVSASVLITFLAGIGFGALYAHRLWRWLWLVEALVGACGVVFALGVGRFASRISTLASPQSGPAGPMVVCVLLLSIPAFLIGCSLPLFAGYLERLGSARAFDKAYSIYNFGASLTVLLVEFWLLRKMGIRGTVLAMAGLNALTSIGLALGFSSLRRELPARHEPHRFEPHLLTALVLASVASAIFQLLMVKLAECLLGPFRETFALVIALVLLGIAVGSVLVGRFRLGFSRLMLLSLGGLVWIVGGLGLIARTYATVHDMAATTYTGLVLLRFAMLAALMGAPAIAFGATIPVLLRTQGDLARDSGKLLFVSSLSNVFGFLLMAFGLHKYFDYGVLVLVVAGLASASVLVYQRFRGTPAIAAVAFVTLGIVLHSTRWDEKLLYLDFATFNSVRGLESARQKLGTVERFKGYQDVFSLVENGDDVSFFVNGYVSVQLGSTTEPMVGALPALLAPRKDRALVLGLGSGMTTGAVGLLFDRTDAVEINSAVIENLWRMKKWNFDVGSMPGVRIFLDDGVHFVRDSKDQYTLIVNTVTSPRYFSASKLYTKDFFETVRERLTPDGLYATWLDAGIGDRGLDIVLKSLHGSFRNCWLIALRAEYFLLVCSNETIAIRQPGAVAGSKTLSGYFFDQAGIPAEWLRYSILHTHPFDLIGDPAAPVNTLDDPVLEFEIARLGKGRIDNFVKRLVSSLNLAELATAVEPGGDYDPMDHLVHLESLIGSSPILTRYSELAAPRFENFEKQNRMAMLEHLASWALFSNTAVAHSEYAWYLSSLDLPAGAIEEYKRSLTIDPRSFLSRLGLGKAYEASGDDDAAVREYSAVLERYPGEPYACGGLGRIALKKKRYAEASTLLAKAVFHYEESADLRYALGLAQEGLGRREDARRTFEQALVLEPGNQAISAALARAGGQP